MKKVYLIGKHSVRTPFFYKCYLPHFANYGYEVVSNASSVDYLVLGFKTDFYSCADKISQVLDDNPNAKIVVLSEEPLWDSLWSDGFSSSTWNITISGKEFHYYNINHFTSDAFEYINIPYFITTEDKYFLQYCMAFRRNAALKEREIIESWSRATSVFASIAEKRLDDKYNKSFPELNCFAQSVYRSKLSEKLFNRSGFFIQGKGWHSDLPRQKLHDWHADKLQKLTGNVRYVSAIENTAAPFYCTEKLFDAYAVLGVPVVTEKQFELSLVDISRDSMLITSGVDVDTDISRINRKVEDSVSALSYKNQIEKYSDYFSKVENLHVARDYFAKRFSSAISEL
ncbi:hypothetical protein [Simiduia agarivorans]|uniref:Uncharacterized protein n=1 Tax=Simiduia agarivorans (strain DSM 21679 / JCM 13881 / BCRC 17597 / SA1) TaxID=1117647 RepID=K4KV01_SIMAS|nr:hypothetical protein [Simiduia agarivorans]AFU97747.1 hypothetical protein M5M_02650 [Simiduia agarivorans SA1 = DSM 21679]